MVHVRNIVKVLSDNGLKLKLSKCEFIKESIKFLRYDLSKKYVSIDESRLEVIKSYARPKNVRMLRSFLGMIQYYKRFIPYLVEKSAPLYEMLRKSNKFIWNIERIKAFEEVRVIFYKRLMLVLPDFEKEFLLWVDASDCTISGVFIQIDKDGREEPICFLSHILKCYELRYSVSEKEMLSVVYAVKKL